MLNKIKNLKRKLNFKNLSINKKIILLSTVIAFLSLFLSWDKINYGYGGPIYTNGFRSRIYFLFILYAYPIFKILKRKKMNKFFAIASSFAVILILIRVFIIAHIFRIAHITSSQEIYYSSDLSFSIYTLSLRTILSELLAGNFLSTFNELGFGYYLFLLASIIIFCSIFIEYFYIKKDK